MDEGGVDALCERIRRKPNLANRVDQATEDAVIKFSTDFPAYGQARTSNELRKLGIFVSASGVRSIWLRHDLANFKTRLKALETIVAEKGGILTKAQVQALEKKKHDDEACGEIETAHSGSWLSGHVLRRHPEGRRACLSADLCRYVFQGRACQALYHQNAHHSG